MDHQQTRHSGLVAIHVVHGLTRAHVLKTKLESAGIPVLLEYESAGPIIGITVDGLGAVRILVPRELAEQAQSLIA